MKIHKKTLLEIKKHRTGIHIKQYCVNKVLITEIKNTLWNEIKYWNKNEIKKLKILQ